MPIKTSGPISITDIVAEFGGTEPHDLSKYYRGGNFVPNKNINSAIGRSGSPISLGQFYGASKIITLSYTGYGGGGAGGSGFENNSNITTIAGSGGFSGILTKATFDALKAGNGGLNPTTIANSNFINAFNVTKDGNINGGVIISNKAAAQSGVGGQNNWDSGAGVHPGQSSPFGAGGAGGQRNSAGSSAPWGNWGAGGGGGGGDQGNGDSYDFFGLINRGGSDEWGKSGQGGFAANGEWKGQVDLDVDIDYVICLGKGGTPAVDVGQHDGGYGNPGYWQFTVDTDNRTFTFTPPTTGNDADRNKSYYFGFRIQRSGLVAQFAI